MTLKCVKFTLWNHGPLHPITEWLSNVCTGKMLTINQNRTSNDIISDMIGWNAIFWRWPWWQYIFISVVLTVHKILKIKWTIDITDSEYVLTTSIIIDAYIWNIFGHFACMCVSTLCPSRYQHKIEHYLVMLSNNSTHSFSYRVYALMCISFSTSNVFSFAFIVFYYIKTTQHSLLSTSEYYSCQSL